jgi:hypothetical protein
MKIDFAKLPSTIAIVGSRSKSKDEEKWTPLERKLREGVRDFMAHLQPNTTVVSGGALGVDSWAEDYARERDDFPNPVIYLPDKSLPIPQRFHERNTLIVVHQQKKGGVVFAFALCDEKNKITPGTRNCTQQCNERDVPYVLYRLMPDGTWNGDVLVGRAFALHENRRRIFLGMQ